MFSCTHKRTCQCQKLNPLPGRKVGLATVTKMRGNVILLALAIHSFVLCSRPLICATALGLCHSTTPADTLLRLPYPDLVPLTEQQYSNGFLGAFKLRE